MHGARSKATGLGVAWGLKHHDGAGKPQALALTSINSGCCGDAAMALCQCFHR